MKQIPGLTCTGYITHPHVNGGNPIPLYEPICKPGGINTLEGWNALADKQNRQTFASFFGRPPKSDAELMAWVISL